MKHKMIIIGLASALFVGCAGTTEIKHVAIEIERAAITANDLQLEISAKGLCAAALSAIGRKYGSDPDKLRNLLGLCGWGEHNIEVMTKE